MKHSWTLMGKRKLACTRKAYLVHPRGNKVAQVPFKTYVFKTSNDTLKKIWILFSLRIYVWSSHACEGGTTDRQSLHISLSKLEYLQRGSNNSVFTKINNYLQVSVKFLGLCVFIQNLGLYVPILYRDCLYDDK